MSGEFSNGVNGVIARTAAEPLGAGTQKSASLVRGRDDKSLPPAGQALPAAADREAQREAVRKAVDRIEQFVRENQRSLRFTIDESSGRTVISVIEKDTGQVVRQIPSEEMLALARRFEEAGAALIDEVV
jgi:flagellar protein FlaG